MSKPTSIPTGSADALARTPRCATKRWMRLISLSFIIFHLSFSRVAAQLSAEYWIDSDPGMGLATPFSGLSATTDGVSEMATAIAADGLSVGIHQLGFRTINHIDGVAHYGPTLTMPFTIPAPVVHDAVFSSIEYFWDEDPGLGLATPLPTTTQGDAAAEALTSIPTDGLSIGEHLLGFRAISVSGGVAHYGPTIVQSVTIPAPVVHDAVFSSIEYFWDEDPGLGLATPLPTTTQGDGGAEVLTSIPTDGLATGNHLLGIRTIASNGGKSCYGPTIVQSVTIRPLKDDPASLVIVQGEYFWNDDPGYGLATPIAFTPVGGDLQSPTTLSLDSLPLPTGSVHGDATLFLRFRGAKGWSPTVAYTVLVDCEGTYTLNALAATSFEARNYQSVGDAIADFASRGISNDITLTVTTKNTDYALDVTAPAPDGSPAEVLDATAPVPGDSSAGTVEQMAAVTAQMAATSTPRHQKTIAFTAPEGSANSISVTVPYTATEWQSYGTVIAFFAQTSQENVTLTINGTPYDFTPATQRLAEVCSGEATAPVALSAISPVLTASWKAQPHAATVLSGFATEGTGDLPAMTITNSGTRLDSLAIAVTLSDQQGNALCTYNYYIYVHASVSTQQFAALSPADGSSLAPGPTTLSWSPIGDAVGGYRVTITDITGASGATGTSGTAGATGTSEASGASGTAEASGTEYLTTATVLDGFAVESGHRYQWTVTAIGFCDELTSPAMTFEGRLLPDLAVTAIALPEVAQAGNMLTVQATIANQGDGPTTEAAWTDRLYYIIENAEAAETPSALLAGEAPSVPEALLAAEALHSGNVQPGESYTVTFTMRVPAVESGQLRVIVETDATAAAMETDDANNRLLSTSAAQLSPFYMATTDLAALRQLYAVLGGSEWSGTPWNPASELILDTNWSGVTFDTDGHVTAITLQGRGLQGSLSPFAATPWQLPRLQSLNLSRNAITGDAAAMVTADGLPALTTLDLSYNQIDSLSAPLPATITTLALGHQHRKYGQATTYVGLDALPTLTLPIGNAMMPELPPITTYDHSAQAFTQHPQLNVYTADQQTRYGRLTWNSVYERYAYTPNGWKQTAAQDEDVILIVTDSYTLAATALPARMHFTAGDANLTGWVDVNDVQRTLNYIVNQNNSSTFGLWAANTFTDGEAPDYINIQDIVCTVNIVLEGQDFAAARRLIPAGPAASEVSAAPESPAGPESPAALLSFSGNQLMLDASAPVAALCIELRGVRHDQVRLLLNSCDWQMQARDTDGGVRLLIFSPTGEQLPVCGGQRLLRLAAPAEAVSAQASSPEAEPVGIAIGSSATAITETPEASEAPETLYDLQGRKLNNLRQRKGLYIKNGKKQIIK